MFSSPTDLMSVGPSDQRSLNWCGGFTMELSICDAARAGGAGSGELGPVRWCGGTGSVACVFGRLPVVGDGVAGVGFVSCPQFGQSLWEDAGGQAVDVDHRSPQRVETGRSACRADHSVSPFPLVDDDLSLPTATLFVEHEIEGSFIASTGFALCGGLGCGAITLGSARMIAG
jgi:hypothetical protein